MKTVCFRVDTGNIVGSGHLMESLAFYRTLRKNAGIRPVFITADNAFVTKRLGEEGIDDIHPVCRKEITAEELREDDDLASTLSILKKTGAGHLIVDLPKRSSAYYRALYEKSESLTVILDDSLQRETPATTVVNFSITQDPAFYGALEQSDRYLIGPSYAPLNESILKFKPVTVREKVDKIFVNQGGSDPYGTTAKIIGALEKSGGDFAVEVIAGGLLKQEHRRQIETALRHAARHRYNLHENIPQQEVFRIMEGCDIAITAAGNTLYELAYFGIPFLVVAPRPEFLNITESFRQHAGIVDLGLREDLDEETIVSELRSLMGDCSRRRQASKALKMLVDGKGVFRVCDRILTVASANRKGAQHNG